MPRYPQVKADIRVSSRVLRLGSGGRGARESERSTATAACWCGRPAPSRSSAFWQRRKPLLKPKRMVEDVLLLLRAPGFYLDVFVGAILVVAVIVNTWLTRKSGK